MKNDLKILKEGKSDHTDQTLEIISCKQVKTKTTFNSQQTSKTWKLFYSTNCKTEYAVYLMECTICNLQYVRKNETPTLD